MPFSKQNRMSTILILAIVMTTTVGVCMIASVANHASSTASTPVITSIVGFVGIAVNQLLGILKSEFARRDSKKESEDIKASVNGVKTQAEDAKKVAIQTKKTMDTALVEISNKVENATLAVVKEAVQAERSQILDHVSLPRTRDELIALIREIVAETKKERKP